MENEFKLSLGGIRERRSIRHFLTDPVPERILLQVLEAARWGPSAGNRQNFRFIVVSHRQTIATMVRVVESETERILPRFRPEARKKAGKYFRDFTCFARAPLVLVPIHRSGGSWFEAGMENQITDLHRRTEADALSSVSAAIMCLLLEAHALGLGACWMTGPLLAETALSKVLEVPEGWVISALIPMGFPGEDPPPPPRRDLDKLIRFLR